jgi:hypothetical protein
MMVPKQPPPNFFAPYPAIKALNQFCIMMYLHEKFKKLCQWTGTTARTVSA